MQFLVRFRYLILVLFVVAHIPFLDSDPDINLSFSRGAHTDEGMYSSQIRNLVNHGEFDLTESDAVIKSPLFAGIQWVGFSIFGASLSVARLLVLTLITIILGILLFRKNTALFSIALIMIGGFFYPVFHFSHYALSEMLATMMIVLGVYFQANQFKDGMKFKMYVPEVLCMFAAVLLKVQFLYVIFLPLMSSVVFWIIKKDNNWIYVVIYQFVFTAMVGGILWFAWIQPNLPLIKGFMDEQSGQLVVGSDSISVIFSNFKMLFSDWRYLGILVSLIVSLIVGIRFTARKNFKWEHNVFVIGVVWLILESHKLIMPYLPTRYLIAPFCAIAIIAASVIFMIVNNKEEKKWFFIRWRVVPLLFFGAIVINIVLYAQSLSSRTYDIKKIDAYLQQHDLKDEVLLGNWATATGWSTKAKTYPCLQGLFNDYKPISSLKPRLVIDEYNYNEFDNPYKREGLDLYRISDSVKSMKLARWDVRIFWLESYYSDSYEN